MRIISRKEFLKLPPKTVYATYNHITHNNAPGDDVDQIFIKGRTIGNDWYYMPLIPDAKGNNEEEIEDNWKKGELDSNYQIESEHFEIRDGMFDDLGRFVIFDLLEIRKMIKKLLHIQDMISLGDI